MEFDLLPDKEYLSFSLFDQAQGLCLPKRKTSHSYTTLMLPLAPLARLASSESCGVWYTAIFLMAIRKITLGHDGVSLTLGRRFTVLRLRQSCVAHARYAWIISPHVLNVIFTDNYPTQLGAY